MNTRISDKMILAEYLATNSLACVIVGKISRSITSGVTAKFSSFCIIGLADEWISCETAKAEGSYVFRSRYTAAARIVGDCFLIVDSGKIINLLFSFGCRFWSQLVSTVTGNLGVYYCVLRVVRKDYVV